MQFAELNNGDKFIADGVEYIKTAPQKISCCKSINAVRSDNSQQKIFLHPNHSVEKVPSAQ